MASVSSKIVLSGSRDIPFDKLVLSQKNVRRVKAGISVEQLAEDIARRTLLQSLSVRPMLDADGKETGKYEVPAGGRRFRALQLLVTQKRLTRTAPVPCVVRTDGLAEEDSLAENVQRAPLHPLDQFRAFQALREAGLSEEEIAARFFINATVVRQRLKLAAVSPNLLEVYAEDGMTLEQLMGFTVTGDHARQEQVWEQLRDAYNREPYIIRRMLTDGAVCATDKRARFVGIEAYEAAGGMVLRDLFEQDQGGWLQDPALLDKLVVEKLQAEAGTTRAEGWTWVEVANEFPYGHAAGLRRLTGGSVPLRDEEQASVDRLRAEQERLEAQCDTGEFSAEADRRLDEIDAELKAVEQRPLAYDPEEVARAGAFVSIAADGTLRIERGYVRPEDEPKAKSEEVEVGSQSINASAGSDRAADIDQATAADEAAKPVAEEEPIEEDGLKPLSDRLVTELTSFKTLALRDALGNDPDTAFLAVLHVLCLKAFYHFGSVSCLEIEARSAGFATQAPGLADSAPARAIEERHQRWADQLPREPGELWDVLLGFDGDSRAMLFAHCAALTVDAVHVPYQRPPKALAHADRLGEVVGLDLVEAGWTPTAESYLGRVSKARILEAVREAKGDQAAELIDHLKKGDMAREAERLLEGSGWLPEPLRGLEVSRPATDEAATAGPATTDDVPDLPAFLAEALPEAIAAE